MNNMHKFKQTEIGMIPEEWEVKKAEELVKVNEMYIGGNFQLDQIEYIDIDSVEGGIIKNVQMLNLENAPSRAKRIVKNEDIIISTVRPNLRHFAFIKNAKPNTIASTGFAVISCKNIHPKFFYYYVTTNKYTNYLSAIADSHTSTYPAFNPDVIENSLIPFPPLHEQRAIAKILSDLDAKIELNQQINKILEEIGKAIFKHWFVDFEFPDEEGKPYKSAGGEMVYNEELGKEIPKGWRVGRLGDGILTSISKPGIDNFVGEKIYLDTASVQNTDIISLNDYITFDKRPSRANMQPKIGSVWFAKMKDSKKGLFFDDYSTFGLDNFILSTGFLGLSVKSSALYYIWNIISSDEFERQKSNLCNGTTMQAINNVTVQSIKALVPDEKVLIKFNEAVKSLYNRIYINFVESQILSQIRDLLLPKLMSGKIRVPLEGKE